MKPTNLRLLTRLKRDYGEDNGMVMMVLCCIEQALKDEVETISSKEYKTGSEKIAAWSRLELISEIL